MRRLCPKCFVWQRPYAGGTVQGRYLCDEAKGLIGRFKIPVAKYSCLVYIQCVPPPVMFVGLQAPVTSSL